MKWKWCAGRSDNGNSLSNPELCNGKSCCNLCLHLVLFVQANLLLEVNEGSEWMEVPSIGKFGSCHYDDICNGMAKPTYPKSFTESGEPLSMPL